jgi:Lamin Tail Domain
LEVTRAPAVTFVIRGLSPSSSEHLWGNVNDASGVTQAFDYVAQMAAARERPVLNEVLANPLGPEPQSEWIELVNDGSIAVNLAHFSVRDSGGSTPLPNAMLSAGEYALLVRDDFAPSASDVPPAQGARLIRVRQLGTSGLSNSGESLALIDADSIVVSALPALAAKAGESLARRHSWSLDDDQSAFTTGTPTPGAPND